MSSKAEERWKRLAAMGAKGEIPTPEGEAKMSAGYPGSGRTVDQAICRDARASQDRDYAGRLWLEQIAVPT